MPPSTRSPSRPSACARAPSTSRRRAPTRNGWRSRCRAGRAVWAGGDHAAFPLPGEAGAVVAVEHDLVSELEALGTGTPAFCHGDPAIDQVLLDGDEAC